MRRKTVSLCRHAKFKFRVLRRHGFSVTDQQVREAVLAPDRVMAGYHGRRIAEKRVSATHAIRVVYEENPREIEVITFYPVRRSP